MDQKIIGILIIAGITSIFCIYKIITTKEKIKWGIIMVLMCAICYLANITYETIMEPIRFRAAEEVRKEVVIGRLIDIRKAQIAFKDNNGYFTNSFDTLISFIKTDSLKVIRAIGNYPEDEMNLEKAIDSGLVITELKPGQTVDDILNMGLALRDTILIPFGDTLFSPGYPIDSLRYIPYSGGEIFHMACGEIETGSGIVVKVFEVVATKRQYLKGLNNNYYLPIEEMRVGSLTEVNNHSGNWGE